MSSKAPAGPAGADSGPTTARSWRRDGEREALAGPAGADPGPSTARSWRRDGERDPRTALARAIRSQSASEVVALVRSGAPLLDGFCLDGLGFETGSALDLALHHGRREVASMLLELQPAQPAAPQVGEEPGEAEDARKLAAALGSEAQPEDGPDGHADGRALAAASRRALAWAARDGRAKLVAQLLEYGVGPLQRDETGRSALHLATARGRGECVTLLLGRGAWAEEPEPHEVSKWAAHWKFGSLFVIAGVTLQLPPAAPTPLSRERYAESRWPPQRLPWIRQKPKPLVKTISALVPVSLGTPPGTGGSKGRPGSREADSSICLRRVREGLMRALMSAIRREALEEIDVLVRRGAPLYPCIAHCPSMGSAREETLLNPVDWAALELRFRSVRRLLELGDGRTAYGRDSGRGALAQVQLARGTIHAVHMAAHHGDLELLVMLLERGAASGQKGLRGESALLAAVRGGHAKAAVYLLQHGAWASEEQWADVIESARAQKLDLVLEAVETTPAALVDERISEAALAADSHAAGIADHQEVDVRLVACTPGPDVGNSPRSGDKIARCMSPFLRSLPSSPDPVIGTLPAAAALGRPGSSLSWRELGPEKRSLRGNLAKAIQKADLAHIAALVRCGAPLDAAFDLKFGERGNCVDWACVARQPKAALKLLELGDERGVGNALAVSAWAAVRWSVVNGFQDVLEELLRRSADPGGAVAPRLARDLGSDGSPLTMAVATGRADMARLLVRHGAWDREMPASRDRLLSMAAGAGGGRGALAAALAEAASPVKAAAVDGGPLACSSNDAGGGAATCGAGCLAAGA